MHGAVAFEPQWVVRDLADVVGLRLLGLCVAL
jgi:hypothetical protein